MLITIDPTPALAERVDDALAELGHAAAAHANDSRELLAAIEANLAITTVLVGPEVPIEDASTIARACRELRADLAIVLVAQPTTATMRTAMRAGFNDVLPPTFNAAELAGALAQVDAGAADLPGATIAVFSAKGGVGTSVLASNLALLLARAQGGPVGLVDLDLSSADLAAMLDIHPRHTIVDVTAGAGAGADALDQVLQRVPDTTLHLLPGPLDPATGEAVAADAAQATIRRLRRTTPLVVVDTSSSFDDVTLGLLETADAIVLPVGLDVLALRSLRVTLQTFDALGIDRDRLHVVVMRADAKVGLTAADVGRTCGVEVAASVPSSRAVVRSLNTATPLALDRPRHPVVKAIDELAGRLLASTGLGELSSTTAGPARSTSEREVQLGAATDEDREDLIELDADDPSGAAATRVVVARTPAAAPPPAAVPEVVPDEALDETVDEAPDQPVDEAPDDELASMPPPAPHGATDAEPAPQRRAIVRRTRPVRS